MENDFLHHAVAKLGLHISLSVEERSVLEEYEGNEFL
jgi:hypothetical protein